MQASIERGRALFNSTVTACASCHGPDGKGDGKTQDFDEWTKDWTIRAGIDPLKKEEWKPLKKLGALKPVKDPARNFHLGAFRGGSEPQDIYLRIVNGIEGTPMPAIAKQPDNPQGVTESEVWDLVHFVMSLHKRDGNQPEVK
jgi:mono/diheme cytochrome c family protein